MKKSILMIASLVMLQFSSLSGQEIIAAQSCQADFTSEVNTMIMAPGLAINFYDKSLGSVEKWLWKFADGTTSDEQNPLHIFGNIVPDNGDSIITTLTIYTKDGCTSSISKVTPLSSETVSDCSSGFEYYENSIDSSALKILIASKSYQFKGSSDSQIESWQWDFGNGNTSVLQNPSADLAFQYSEKYGQYGSEVCLTTITKDSCKFESCQFIPWESQQCNVTFSFERNPIFSSTRNAFNFYLNGPKMEISSINWDFGDGKTSTDVNPIHGYPDCGGNDCNGIYYVASVKVVYVTGCEASYTNIIYMSDSIIQPDCNANFYYNVYESYPPVYHFIPEDINNAKYYWDFGDGTYSYETSPSHSFGSPVYLKDMIAPVDSTLPYYNTVYNVCLTISNENGCYKTSCQPVYTQSNTYSSCKNRIKINASFILGDYTCSSSAKAELVDFSGNKVEAIAYSWSNGSNESEAKGLCNNSVYYVKVTNADNCVTAASFAISDYTDFYYPGSWTYEYFNNEFIFHYDYADTAYTCEWVYNDSLVLYGNTVSVKNTNGNYQWVDLVLKDNAGNTIYTERIDLTTSPLFIKPYSSAITETFPNPAQQILNIKSKEITKFNSVNIYDATGRLRSFKIINNSFGHISLNISELPKGIYFGKASGINGNTITFKFVK